MSLQNPHKKWRIIFAGSPAYSIPSLETILELSNIEVVGVLTQKAKPAGRGQALKSSAIGEFAQNKDLLVLTPDSLKKPDIQALIASLYADCGFVIAYGKIIPKAVLDILPLGWLNLHASLLPRWRGASPIQYTIMSGDAISGVTLMKIDYGLDTGGILTAKEIELAADETSQSLANKLSSLSADLISENLTAYLLGKLSLKSQPEIGITLAPKIEKTDGQIFWHEPAKVIERKIRALNPWPGTYSTWQSKKIFIKQAAVFDQDIEPGKIIKTPLGCAIGTSQKSIFPKTLQLPGKKPLAIEEFLRGYPKFINSSLT